MFNSVRLSNFGPLQEIDWSNLGNINLVIGENGSGKTFFLKALYSTARTVEEYQRGDDKRTAEEILAEKLYWTFQPEKIGDLVSKGSKSQISCRVQFQNSGYKYRFGKDTSKQISPLKNKIVNRHENSIFLPSKEVLTIQDIILKSRWQDKAFGFDDTYYDLARALQFRPLSMRWPLSQDLKRKTYTKLSDLQEERAEYSKEMASLPAWPINSDAAVKIHQRFRDLLEGKFEYDNSKRKWVYKKGNEKYEIGLAAEGYKKLAALDVLLSNNYIGKGSIVFIDEPESNLHPAAISNFLDIIHDMSRCGIQFFLASHSYFVVKKLYLIALEQKVSIPVLSLGGDKPTYHNLRDGMPENPIINESIRLYQKEVGLALGQ